MQLVVREVRCEPARPHLGWLVAYTDAVLPYDPRTAQRRPRAVLKCRAGAEATLDLQAPRTGHALHVHWFPRIRETDNDQKRSVVVQEGFGTVPDLRVLLQPTEVQLQPLDNRDTGLRLTLQLVPTAAAAGEIEWGRRVAEAPSGEQQRLWSASLEQYMQTASDFYRVRLRFDRENDRLGDWRGSNTRLPHAGRVPMATFTVAATRNTVFASLDVLEHWARLACARLRLDPGAHERFTVHQCSELLAEVAQTRLLALVYQIDVNLQGQVTDDWSFLSAHPDLSQAAFDCEDGTADILSALATLAALDLASCSPLLRKLVAHARRYVFLQTLGVLYSKGNDTFFWHSYVTGWDRRLVDAALAGQTTTAEDWVPPLLIESTEYTTADWELQPDPVPVEALHDKGLLCGNPRTLCYVGVKIPAERLRLEHQLMHPQYRQTIGFLLPHDYQERHGAAEVVLCPTPDTYGVPTSQLLRSPLRCARWQARSLSHPSSLSLSLDRALSLSLTYTKTN